MKNGRVKLTAQTNASRTLVTTIPAENGWTARVDGNKAELGTYLDTFLSLELEEGAHTVELRYTAPGLIPGLVLGGLAVFGLSLAAIDSRKRKVL